MSTNPIPLEYGFFYHIFNRGNNHENIFTQQRNYAYFMELWWKHTLQIADTYAFCLMRNHFHVSVFLKPQEDLSDIKIKEPSQYFANFFNAYVRGFNNATGRSGALFERPFERIAITSERQLMRLIIYIHQNPQKHKFVKDFRDWPYSSYQALLSDRPTFLHREQVLAWFNGRVEFDALHQMLTDEKSILDLIGDDED
jgi:REP element-mobilizing transposase RayT